METNLILAAAAAGLIGLIVGILIGKAGGGSSLRQRRAEQQIEELRSEYTRYQAQVNEHFMESADLLRQFNDSYRQMNEHLARGANRLCNDEEWLEELSQENAPAQLENSAKEKDGVEPPRDYAPRSNPEDKGTLSEDFGLPENQQKA